MVALHQFQRLTFDVVLSTNNVGEHSWEPSAVELGGRDLHVELASVLVLQVELNIVLLYALSALVAACPQGVLTPKLCAVLVGVLCSLLVGRARNIEQAINARLHCVCALISKL